MIMLKQKGIVEIMVVYDRCRCNQYANDCLLNSSLYFYFFWYFV